MSDNQTILSLQRKLLIKTDPQIVCEIDGHCETLTAVNISEDTFMDLTFITNDPIYKNSHMTMIDVEVFLNGNLFSTPIYGLNEIIKARYEFSDTEAFLQKNVGETNGITHSPFANGFGKNQNLSNEEEFKIMSIRDVVSSLSMLTDELPLIDSSTKITLKVVLSMSV